MHLFGHASMTPCRAVFEYASCLRKMRQRNAFFSERDTKRHATKRHLFFKKSNFKGWFSIRRSAGWLLINVFHPYFLTNFSPLFSLFPLIFFLFFPPLSFFLFLPFPLSFIVCNKLCTIVIELWNAKVSMAKVRNTTKYVPPLVFQNFCSGLIFSRKTSQLYYLKFL